MIDGQCKVFSGQATMLCPWDDAAWPRPVPTVSAASDDGTGSAEHGRRCSAAFPYLDGTVSSPFRLR
ncbi:hypothetical protein SCATT_p15620 (plasmid) [Streptantibioticus cattleyicolor NRRL 8057 = DSM 46488]|uniref:Uncharacterized protein n=1 Tax=Streptantibioticus cattleyicolor (strain ATCC 35852 / DSM 46488 / JCM 4925 / NBRC 14057 / NRRL 8057) TaxID=1003195 RepID=G8XH37_STREN|nr:hypothetical protein SCATT_p15620 [Streptantibioticus cattleyicolor NRRL 8057 = DSM 46488]